MATLGGTHLTLADLAKREDPNGMTAKIAETLHQTNSILDDIPWVESNLPTGHRSTIRTGLPTVTTRRLNQGVVAGKSTTNQITDGIALLETQSWTDSKLLELSSNPAETRRQEGAAHVEAMGQKKAELLFYGSEADDETEFNGLSVRYASTTATNSGENVLNASGSNADVQSSIWLVGWSPGKVFGIYPRGSVGGLRHKDLGEQAIPMATSTVTALDPGTAKMVAVGDQWTWDCGIAVADWRYVVRIANAEVSVAKAISSGGDQSLTAYDTNIMYLMSEAMHHLPSIESVRPVFYMNRGLFIAFDRMLLATANLNVFMIKDVNGKMVMSFRGIQIKLADQLTQTEAVIS